MSGTLPRVLIADDHRMLADAYTRILADEFEVVGVVGDGRELLEVAPTLTPDVILLDISMPRLNGLDAARSLRQVLPDVVIVVVTMHQDAQLAASAFQAGVAGYVTKSAAASELRTALVASLAGERYLTPLISHDQVEALMKRTTTRGGGRLTQRQREVLQLLAEGKSMKQVAFELGLSTRTVQHHKYKIMEEQGIDSNAGLLQLAIEERLIDTPHSA